MQPRRHRSALVCSLIALISGCGGAAPKAELAPPAQKSAAPALPPAADLSPVAAPSGLIGLGRLSRPGDLLRTVSGWVSIPFDPGMLDALQPGVSKAVAIDAPVEFALALADSERIDRVEAEVVASIGLSSVEQARALLEQHIGQKLQERGTSVLVTPEDAKLNCAIAPSVGKASTRLVCGDNAKSLEHLLPYATRGLPLENLGPSDLHTELRFEPLQKRFGAALRMGRTVAVPTILKELSLADPRFDRPLADVAHALGDELLDLFDDADRIALDLGASSKPEQLELKLSVSYRGRASLISQLSAEAPKHMGPPSAQFFDLPADAAAAGYASAADPKRFDKPRSLMEGLLDGLLAHFEVSAGLRRDTKTAVDAWIVNGSPVVYATGNALATPDKPKSAASDAMSLALGWRIYGIEAPAGPFKESLKTLVRLGADKAFRNGLDRLFEGASATSESGKKKAGKAENTHPSDWIKLRSKTVAQMPAGSEVALIELNHDASEAFLKEFGKRSRKANNEAKQAPANLSYSIAVVPDGARTWLVWAGDDKTLVERAQTVTGAGKVAKLSTRADLAPMRGQNNLASGFMTLQLARGWLELALSQKGKSVKDVDSLFSTLPNHGNTPMFYRSIARGDDRRHAIELSTTIPRAVFDDAAAAVPSLMMLMP